MLNLTIIVNYYLKTISSQVNVSLLLHGGKVDMLTGNNAVKNLLITPN